MPPQIDLRSVNQNRLQVSPALQLYGETCHVMRPASCGVIYGAVQWLTHLKSRLTATVSLEQLRQGSARSNSYFDSTTAEVCATIKRRTGAMGQSWEVHPWSLTLAKETAPARHKRWSRFAWIRRDDGCAGLRSPARLRSHAAVIHRLSTGLRKQIGHEA